MEQPPRELTVGGVTLRHLDPTQENAEALTRAIHESWDSLADWMPWAVGDRVTVQDELNFLDKSAVGWEDGSEFGYGIFFQEKLVGGCGVTNRRGPAIREIGYWLHVDARGKGVMTTAVALLTNEAFKLSNVAEVRIYSDHNNERSAAIPKRLGFQFMGTVPAESFNGLPVGGRLAGDTHLMYSLTRQKFDQSNVADFISQFSK